MALILILMDDDALMRCAAQRVAVSTRSSTGDAGRWRNLQGLRMKKGGVFEERMKGMMHHRNHARYQRRVGLTAATYRGSAAQRSVGGGIEPAAEGESLRRECGG